MCDMNSSRVVRKLSISVVFRKLGMWKICILVMVVLKIVSRNLFVVSFSV